MTGQHSGLAGRVAVITGGGGGIGRALATGFARAGAIAVVADLNGEDASALVRDIESEGHRALALRVDVASADSVGAMIEAAMAAFGRVDILVNNAAKFSELAYREFTLIPIEEWKAVIDVNLTGAFLTARAVEPHMRQAGWGRIINVSSGSVRMGRPHFLHYVSSKSALVGMSRSLARELGPHGITVNTLLPGVVFTALQRRRLPEDYQRMILSGQCIPEPLPPEAMVGPVLFLASDASRYVTGQELAVDGGLTHG
jgi:3-oxoacyl-[acyl-carrier protein] reductase